MKQLRFSLLAFLLLASTMLLAQTTSSIRGKVKDEKGEGIAFANIVLKQNGVFVKGGQTDFDGNYEIGPLDGGRYELEASYVGYKTTRTEDIIVRAGTATEYTFKMEVQGEIIDEVIVVGYKVPLIKTTPTAGQTLTSEDFMQRGTMDLTSIANTSPRVTQTDEGRDTYSAGARSDGNDTYVDGVRVRGNIGISANEVEQVQTIVGGVPAQYGDATGAITNLVTKSPSAKFESYIFMESSQVTDPYQSNQLGFGISGPILSKPLLSAAGTPIKGANGKPMRESIIGFRLSGNSFTSLDTRPSSLGSFKLKDDVLNSIRNQPMELVNGSLVQRARNITADQLETTNVRPNNRDMSGQLSATLYFKPTKDIEVRFTSQYYRQKDPNAPDAYRLLNYDRNFFDQNEDFRVRGIFKHNVNVGTDTSRRSGLVMSNLFYSIQGDYTRNTQVREDALHGSNLWNYGYVGQFQERYAPDFALAPDPNNPGQVTAVQASWRPLLDTAIMGNINPYMANYNNLVRQSSNFTNVRSGYLAENGRLASQGSDVGPGLFSGSGTPIGGGYTKAEQNQATLRVQMGFDLKKAGSLDGHKIMLGYVYESRVDRSYNIRPFDLWTQARNLANSHIVSTPDVTRDSLYVATVDLDSIAGSPRGTLGTAQVNVYPYTANVGQIPSGGFAENIRASLNRSGNDWINVDNLLPSQMRLDWFSADELISYTSARSNTMATNYYGYDYLGNVVGTETPWEKFFTDTKKRPIAPFNPIYQAGYIEDAFRYGDLNFRLGLRVDYYDANTKVLRDPYSLYGGFTAGELRSNASRYASNPNFRIPSSVPNDAMVYVEDPSSPEQTRVTAFRTGDQWYDRNGTALNNVNTLAVDLGTSDLVPARKDFSTALDIQSADFANKWQNSFKDFDPRIIPMPRFAFSFPIGRDDDNNPTAEFFAHYDVTSQRPTSGQSIATPFDYYNLQQRVSQDDNLFNNPNLSPFRKVDYEIGFQQVISKYSAIKFSLYYNEFRDLIQVRKYLYAYPKNYETYANNDFSTTKGLTVEYDLRRFKRLRIMANYTLQFAQGTGSSASSNRNLGGSVVGGINRQPFYLNYDQRHKFYVNLQYEFADNDGPTFLGNKWLSNFGANLELTLNSGFPYTQKQISASLVSDGDGGTGVTLGSLNGARLPWNWRADFRVYKRWDIGKGTSKIRLNTYIRIQNLFDVQNILGVYTASGDPRNDGWLTDPNGTGPSFLGGLNQADQTSYELLYGLRMNDPSNFSLPRRIYLGARIEF